MHTYLFFLWCYGASLTIVSIIAYCVNIPIFEISISNHYNVEKESPAVTLLMNINVLLYLAGTEIIAVVM